VRILFIYDGEYPWDIRVEKLCNSLIKFGSEVHLVCRNKSNKKRYEFYNGIHIHRVSSLPKALQILNGVWTFPFFLSPVWIMEIFKITKNKKFDLICIRDLPLALCGILVGKMLKIPTLLDMAECYPEMLRCTWKFEKFLLRNILIRNPYLADVIEKISLKLIDYVFVMVEESRLRLISKNIPPDKIYIVSNTPELEKIKRTFKSSYFKNDNNKRYILTYVGLVNSSRGIEKVIDAVQIYAQSNPSIMFWILGEGKAKLRLEKKVKELALEEHIKFYGWVENFKAYQLINQSDVCIVPHHRCTHWDNTIPNKLFDYMAFAKPVLVSNVPPMLKIVFNEECGCVYIDYDVDDLVDKLRFLENSIIRDIMGKKGQKAVEMTYNWANEEKVIQSVLSRISLHSKRNVT